MLALVFWLLEKRTSIVEIDCIFEEDRHPGRIAQVLWGKERHPAQVVKIASKYYLYGNCFIIGLLEMIIVHINWRKSDIFVQWATMVFL